MNIFRNPIFDPSSPSPPRFSDPENGGKFSFQPKPQPEKFTFNPNNPDQINEIHENKVDFENYNYQGQNPLELNKYDTNYILNDMSLASSAQDMSMMSIDQSRVEKAFFKNPMYQQENKITEKYNISNNNQSDIQKIDFKLVDLQNTSEMMDVSKFSKIGNSTIKNKWDNDGNYYIQNNKIKELNNKEKNNTINTEIDKSKIDFKLVDLHNTSEMMDMSKFSKIGNSTMRNKWDNINYNSENIQNLKEADKINNNLSKFEFKLMDLNNVSDNDISKMDVSLLKNQLNTQYLLNNEKINSNKDLSKLEFNMIDINNMTENEISKIDRSLLYQSMKYGKNEFDNLYNKKENIENKEIIPEKSNVQNFKIIENIYDEKFIPIKNEENNIYKYNDQYNYNYLNDQININQDKNNYLNEPVINNPYNNNYQIKTGDFNSDNIKLNQDLNNYNYVNDKINEIKNQNLINQYKNDTINYNKKEEIIKHFDDYNKNVDIPILPNKFNFKELEQNNNINTTDYLKYRYSELPTKNIQYTDNNTQLPRFSEIPKDNYWKPLEKNFNFVESLDKKDITYYNKDKNFDQTQILFQENESQKNNLDFKINEFESNKVNIPSKNQFVLDNKDFSKNETENKNQELQKQDFKFQNYEYKQNILNNEEKNKIYKTNYNQSIEIKSNIKKIIQNNEYLQTEKLKHNKNLSIEKAIIPIIDRNQQNLQYFNDQDVLKKSNSEISENRITFGVTLPPTKTKMPEIINEKKIEIKDEKIIYKEVSLIKDKVVEIIEKYQNLLSNKKGQNPNLKNQIESDYSSIFKIFLTLKEKFYSLSIFDPNNNFLLKIEGKKEKEINEMLLFIQEFLAKFKDQLSKKELKNKKISSEKKLDNIFTIEELKKTRKIDDMEQSFMSIKSNNITRYDFEEPNKFLEDNTEISISMISKTPEKKKNITTSQNYYKSSPLKKNYFGFVPKKSRFIKFREDFILGENDFKIELICNCDFTCATQYWNNHLKKCNYSKKNEINEIEASIINKPRDYFDNQLIKTFKIIKNDFFDNLIDNKESEYKIDQLMKNYLNYKKIDSLTLLIKIFDEIIVKNNNIKKVMQLEFFKKRIEFLMNLIQNQIKFNDNKKFYIQDIESDIEENTSKNSSNEIIKEEKIYKEEINNSDEIKNFFFTEAVNVKFSLKKNNDKKNILISDLYEECVSKGIRPENFRKFLFEKLNK